MVHNLKGSALKLEIFLLLKDKKTFLGLSLPLSWMFMFHNHAAQHVRLFIYFNITTLR